MSDPIQQIEQQPAPAPQPVVIEWPAEFRRSVIQAKRLRQYKDRAKLTAETLRFNHYVRCGTLSDWMQRTGNWLRKYIAPVRFRY